MNLTDYWNRDDTKKHFIVGVGIWAVSHFFVPAYAMYIPLAVGIAKEIFYDKLAGKGTPDISDAIATGLPGLLSFV